MNMEVQNLPVKDVQRPGRTGGGVGGGTEEDSTGAGGTRRLASQNTIGRGENLSLCPGSRQKPEKGMSAGDMTRFLVGKQSPWPWAGLWIGRVQDERWMARLGAFLGVQERRSGGWDLEGGRKRGRCT